MELLSHLPSFFLQRLCEHILNSILLDIMLIPLLLNPARPGGSTRWLDQSRFNKRSAVATARPNPGEPGRDPKCFFFQMWDLKPISIYTLCFQEKSHVFSMWDKKPFGLNT